MVTACKPLLDPMHPIARARERYGLSLEPVDLAKICRLIQRNKGKLEDRDGGDGATVWRLEYKGVMLRVVVDRTFYVVKTFLPPRDSWSEPIVRRAKKVWARGKQKWVRRVQCAG